MSFRKRYNASLWQVFLCLFCSKCQLILYFQTMYIYCVYHATLYVRKSKTTVKMSQNSWNKRCFQWCPLWSQHAYAVAVHADFFWQCTCTYKNYIVYFPPTMKFIEELKWIHSTCSHQFQMRIYIYFYTPLL